jgi:hypothetical protein
MIEKILLNTITGKIEYHYFSNIQAVIIPNNMTEASEEQIKTSNLNNEKLLNNSIIYSQISDLENSPARPLRELLIGSDSDSDNAFAKSKITEIDNAIAELRKLIQK